MGDTDLANQLVGAMTDLGDENQSGSDEPNLVGKEPALSLWSGALTGLMALLGPVLFVVMILLKPAYEMSLLRTSSGMKMLAFAVALQFMGMAVHFSCRVLINRKRAGFLCGLVYIGMFVLFYFPVIFIVLVGPAAIAIYERMLSK